MSGHSIGRIPLRNVTNISDVDPLFEIEELRSEFVSYCNREGRAVDPDIRDRQSRIQQVLFDLPMAFRFSRDKFYVRACYPLYFEIIMATLAADDFDLLSVTGTPGIGKSVFYIYFFQRYRERNPSTTIVTASFDQNRKVLDCVVFKPRRKPIHKGKEIPDISGAIYLFDGPPSSYLTRNRMICFTSPNFDWFRSVAKCENHSRIVFPTWTFDELIEANELCGLSISLQELDDRFNFFGGSARYCLTTLTDFKDEGKDLIFDKIGRLQNFSGLTQCLQTISAPTDHIAHLIFHSVPVIKPRPPFTRFEQRTVCSDQVYELISTNTSQESEEQRREFCNFLKLQTSCATLLGNIFKDFCRRAFCAGSEETVTWLDDPNQSFPLSISSDRYVHMKRNCEAIDAIQLEGTDLMYMFQITVAEKHSVSAHGILRQLLFRNKVDEFFNGSFRVRLVFVVPLGRENGLLGTQKVVQCEVLPSTDIKSIRWVHQGWKDSLADRNIKTVQQLYTAFETADEYVERLEDQFKVISLLRAHEKNTQRNSIGDIPQFLLVKAGFFNAQ